jgi:aspartate-semialdehyde dehydrogenase
MRIAVLGATGLVGRETLALVARAWPGTTLELYASRDQELDLGGTRHPVKGAQRLEDRDAPHGDLAFVALDDDHSKRYVPRLLGLGYRVVDKSNTYRGDPKVPLVTAGVNTELVDDAAPLVANPNCTTIPLMLALQPLRKAYGLAGLYVSTYQAVSGAGIAALDGFLEASQRGYERPERLGLAFAVAGYAGNTVPHAGGTDDSGFSSEERKLMFESRKILAMPDLGISVQCCRVAVAVGHYENAWVTLERKVELDEIGRLYGDAGKSPFVRWAPGSAGEGLSAVATVHERDRALVGRLRRDPRDASGRTICLTVAGDNLRVGAATNAVRIASRWFASRDPELQA